MFHVKHLKIKSVISFVFSRHYFCETRPEPPPLPPLPDSPVGTHNPLIPLTESPGWTLNPPGTLSGRESTGPGALGTAPRTMNTGPGIDHRGTRVRGGFGNRAGVREPGRGAVREPGTGPRTNRHAAGGRCPVSLTAYRFTAANGVLSAATGVLANRLVG
jgi:hypothetical protein